MIKLVFVAACITVWSKNPVIHREAIVLSWSMMPGSVTVHSLWFLVGEKKSRWNKDTRSYVFRGFSFLDLVCLV